MEILEDTRGDAVVLTLKGRIDSATAKTFEEHLTRVMRDGRGAVIVDFRTLDYISSAGLRVVLIAAKLAKPKGRAFLLCGMKPSVREVFAVSGFTKILVVKDNLEEALAAA